jgi:hypothetical protein
MFRTAVLALGLSMASAAVAEPVPKAMQGVWGKNGHCDRLADRLTITAHRAGWGKGPFMSIELDVEDPDRPISWTQDGNVDYFVFGRSRNFLIHHLEGRGSALPADWYERCVRNQKLAPMRKKKLPR